MQLPADNLAPAHPHSVIRTPWRWAMAGVGVVCFALAGVGAVVPGMPTTVFVLLGSYFLVRSCPWLEERLLTSRLFRPYARFVRSREPMSGKARAGAIGAMSVSVGASLVVLAMTEKLTPVLASVIVALWLTGFVAIMLFRRPRA